MGLALNINPISTSVVATVPSKPKRRTIRKNSAVVSLLDAHRFARLTPEDAIDKFKGTVLKWANYYIQFAPRLELEDLISAGNIGVIKAVKRYSPERMCYSLSSFASYTENSIRWEIKNEISLFVRGRAETVRVKVGRKRKRYVNKVVRHIPEFISFDTPAGKDDDGLELHELIEDTHASTAYKDILVKEMWEYVDRLEGQQRLVLTLRFKDEGKTLEQVGEILGVTKERVRQIEEKAVKALRSLIL